MCALYFSGYLFEIQMDAILSSRFSMVNFRYKLDFVFLLTLPIAEEFTMPIVTLTVRSSFSRERRTQVLTAIHKALVASGVPATDRFHRVLALADEDFQFDPSYPDLLRPRTADFALIEILLSAGRSIKVKKKIVQDALQTLSDQGFDPENVMISFIETTWESWSFGGGRFLHG
jgi:hypothetical protein